ncbi:hypothetical protein GCM10027030_09040 [Luteococcus sediminum]
MNPLLSMLRPVAVRQGRESLTGLTSSPADRHGVCRPTVRDAGAPAGSLERLHLVLLGDRTAAGAGLGSAAQALPGLLGQLLADRERCEVLWQVVAEDDADIADVHGRLVQLVAPSAQVVVLAVGFNDLLSRREVRQWGEELTATLRLLRRDGRRLVVLGVPPVADAQPVRWPLSGLLRADAAALDRASRRACDGAGAVFVPVDELGDGATAPGQGGIFADDGIHLGADGQQLLAQTVAANL